MIALNDIARLAAATGLVCILSACGSSGGSSTAVPAPAAAAPATLQGVFSDAPVAGLSYATSSGGSGTTDGLGTFNYAAGDTVTFSVGGLTLGSAAPTVSSAGNAIVTPVSIVAGAKDATDPKVTAIGELLGTLNSIAVANNTGASGTFTIPGNAATLLSKLGTTDVASVTTAQLQSVVTAAGVGNVVASADAQANMNAGINSASLIGTTWSGSCTCNGGGTFYFEPNGNLTGFTADGELLAGTWTGSPAAAGGVQLALSSSSGGYTKNGTIPAGSSVGTAEVDNSSGAAQGTLTFTQVSASATLSNTLYLGGWYGTYTPNATGIAAGDSGGQAYVILAPDGSFSGITDGANAISGTWNPSTGIGTASFSDGSGGTVSISVNVATKTGTVTKGGATFGSISFSRSGTLTMNSKAHSGGSGSSGGGSNTSATATPKTLLLNVTVAWPKNVGNVVSSLALSLNVNDAGGKQISGGIKSEINPLGAGAIANTTTDNIAVSYLAGSGASYSLSVGPSNCSIAGGSGSVVDANSGNASAYPTVAITCN